VVFYDYDEIAYMSDVNFRCIPPPRTPEDELSAEAWYPVAPNDVFPEEFEPFLLSGDKVRRHFDGHRDLLTAGYWNAVKERVGRGQIADVFPYPDAARFARRYAKAESQD
jgi:isocitrate dehydrogenase kinase/phosphatase